MRPVIAARGPGFQGREALAHSRKECSEVPKTPGGSPAWHLPCQRKAESAGLRR